jgi:uncharacterized membrane protein YgcG
MKSLAALAALAITLGSTAIPASARDSFVIDNAHLLSADTISAINAKVADFNAIAHKEVFVDTEMSVDGASAKAAAEKIFAQQQINGVLIYVAKSPKTIGVLPDRAASQFFPATSTSAIRSAIRSGFNAGDFNGGITNGVDLTLSQYRSHLGALTQKKVSYAPVGSGENVAPTKAGFNLSWIWILIVLAVIFFVIRGIFRAMAGPRMMPPGYGGGGPMMGGGGYGGYGPGYGGGYGGGGGGGSFWSGLMGGLGGAFLGNELFGGRRDDFGGNQAGFVDQGQGGQSVADTSGFQSDPGQADVSNASFGDWGGGGDSGSGWGGGGDSGGGWGGGDSGGGGDNSGGGW